MPKGISGRTQAQCHPEMLNHCKGLCAKCYRKSRTKTNSEYQKKRHKNNPDLKKRDHLKPLVWTLELFYSTINKQNNKCAICNKILNLEKVQNGARACADHEHTVPPKPRGVICSNCNTGIGQFQDDPEICAAASAYLLKFC